MTPSQPPNFPNFGGSDLPLGMGQIQSHKEQKGAPERPLQRLCLGFSKKSITQLGPALDILLKTP